MACIANYMLSWGFFVQRLCMTPQEEESEEEYIYYRYPHGAPIQEIQELDGQSHSLSQEGCGEQDGQEEIRLQETVKERPGRSDKEHSKVGRYDDRSIR